MEGGDDANEDERAEARSVILCRLLGVVRAVRRDWELVVLSEDLVVLRSGTTGLRLAAARGAATAEEVTAAGSVARSGGDGGGGERGGAAARAAGSEEAAGQWRWRRRLEWWR